ncbi:MAG TPA: phosphoribosylglycinamide formyltransferase [Abditibacteriaceae bacterium]|jgi:phosphoribosylglycinamide formyltransferase-1
MKTVRIGILVSGGGRGSNVHAILSAINAGQLQAHIALLVATKEDHGAVALAREAGVKTLVLPTKECATPEEWDHRVADALYQEGVSLVCLAGYLRRLTHVLLDAFPRRIINVHPSLLPSFGGKGMYGTRVHRAVLDYGCKVTGCTVHFCNEHLDAGAIIAQACVPVEDDDTPDTLQARVQKQEHRLYPQCIQLIAQDRVRFDGAVVKIRKAE